MKKMSLGVALLLLHAMFSPGPAAAEPLAENYFSIGLQPGLTGWSFLKKAGGSTDSEKIAEAKADMGLSVMPRVDFNRGNVWARGFLLLGQNEFSKKGDGKVNVLGVDFGYKSFFLGYRRMSASFSFKDELIKDHAIGDVVVGGIVRTRPDKLGWTGLFSFDFGLRAILGTLSSSGGDAPEDTTVMNLDAGVGYNFERLPLNLRANFNLWVYMDPIDKRQGLLGESILYWEDVGYGPSVAVEYRF